MPMILALRIESMMSDWANDTLFPSTLQNKQISKPKQNSPTRKTLEGQAVRLKSIYGEVWERKQVMIPIHYSHLYQKQV